jgi:hypothetical protein
MNDFERRLRAAMSAVAGAPPPPGLMAGIRRRHRRHLLRVGAGCVAVVAALALAAPPLTHALRYTGSAGPSAVTGRGSGQPCPRVGAVSFGCSHYVGPGAGASAPQVCPVFCGPPSSQVKAAPGTILRDCQSGNGGGQEIAGYRARSVRAGPVWFVGARKTGYWPASRKLSHGEVEAVGVPVAVRAGATAVVRVAPAAQSRFRFLHSFNKANRYSMRAGERGVTFAACPASYLGPVTVFWIGYLNGGLACVPFQVSVPGQRPVRVTLSVHGGTCAT